MTTSELAISTAMDKLEVESNMNTPGFQTPPAGSSLSEDTVTILEQAAAKLKSSKKGGTRRGRLLSPDGNQPSKRKRVGSPIPPHERFPEAAKPLYLKAKNLYIRKLHLATNVHVIKSNLNDGKFPQQMDFKCLPTTNDNAQFSLNWTQAVNVSKRQLTVMWIDELSRKYTVCKSDIRMILENLKETLSSDQFKEMKALLEDRYKEAASKKLARKVNTAPPALPKGKGKKFPPGKKNPRRNGKPDIQLKKLLNGLTALLN